MRIYQDDGTMLGTANGGATCELNTVALPVSGTYTVLALDYYGSGTGDYLLHAQCTNDPVGATSLTYNQTYAADWALRAETDAYTFSGSDGDLLLARLAEDLKSKTTFDIRELDKIAEILDRAQRGQRLAKGLSISGETEDLSWLREPDELLRLAAEEGSHKHAFEKEYDDRILASN
mgnify:CR=1 FL=1